MDIQRKTERFSISWFVPHIGALAEALLDRIQAPGVSPGLPTWVVVAQVLGDIFCFPQAIIRELDCEWNDWYSNRSPYGLLAQQAATLVTIPQHQP